MLYRIQKTEVFFFVTAMISFLLWVANGNCQLGRWRRNFCRDTVDFTFRYGIGAGDDASARVTSRGYE